MGSTLNLIFRLWGMIFSGAELVAISLRTVIGYLIGKTIEIARHSSVRRAAAPVNRKREFQESDKGREVECLRSSSSRRLR